ncbi:MAG: NAD(+) synthase [Flavobacteriales bacterium]|nr:NAD(+) synthase [Flavobacteriales bacterium]
MNSVANYIVDWLNSYAEKSRTKGFVIGISGGVDSALTSTLCALTGKKVVLVNMPILQTSAEYDRAQKHIEDLKSRFENVSSFEIDLTSVFQSFSAKMPFNTDDYLLAMANSRARIRMTTLYAIAQVNSCLVAGTGNKIEDFGIGFYTKYGDGGVDLSPIADLTKTEVFKVAKSVQVIDDILQAKPTDGLWPDGRSDEDQIGATYPELEWAMDFEGDENLLSERQKEVLKIYRTYNRANKHKMEPIPVCELPKKLKENLLSL